MCGSVVLIAVKVFAGMVLGRHAAALLWNMGTVRRLEYQTNGVIAGTVVSGAAAVHLWYRDEEYQGGLGTEQKC